MGFADIDAEELDLIVVLFIHLLDTHGTLDIWRSGKAAENKGDWFVPLEF